MQSHWMQYVQNFVSRKASVYTFLRSIPIASSDLFSLCYINISQSPKDNMWTQRKVINMRMR